MAHSAPSDDGSPARLIATMVGIVGILLLGSLAWSAVGALFSALGEATAVLSPLRAAPTRLPAVVAATPQPTANSGPTVPPTALASTATPAIAAPVTVEPTPIPETPMPAPSARAPWILLPQPAPGSHVPPGPLVVEARGRGEAAISAIRLELDGAALPTSFEQRDASTWRAAASIQVASGPHAVRATVVDAQGHTGGFRWTFEAGP